MSGAGSEWTVLEFADVKRISDIRAALDELRVGFRDVVIIRMGAGATAAEHKRIDVTSIGPTVVSSVKDGAPGARTTFGITEKRDRLVMLTQDVPNRRAFHREIPMTELTEGRRFRFPVVLESGAIIEQAFTVQQVVVR